MHHAARLLRRPLRPLSSTLLLLACTALGVAPDAQDGRVVFLAGENEYDSARSLQGFSAELESALGVATEVRVGREQEMPSPPGVDEAELLVLALRYREPTPEQFERFEAWFDAGKPVVALRTTSHLFEGEALRGWFPPRFGGHYKGHAPNRQGTLVGRALHGGEHPALRGMPASFEAGHGGTYDAQPLADGARVLLWGRTGALPAQPVAWTFAPLEGQRLLYTSLGSAENFEREDFRRFLANACAWALGREVPAGGLPGFEGEAAPPPPLMPPLPAPPALDAPEGAQVLFGGESLEHWRHWDPSAEPRALRQRARSDTSAGGPSYEFPRWRIEEGALVARPGFGDLLTLEDYGDYHLHLDFLLPGSDARAAPEFAGQSGVYVSGRWELALAHSQGQELSETSSGALAGTSAPLVDAAGALGAWQSLDLTYEHRAGGEARLSAWLNGQRVQDDVLLEEHSPYGFVAAMAGSEAGEGQDEARFHASAEDSERCGWDEGDFVVRARFRTGDDGTLVSKCPPEGEWVPDAKALFLRNGRLVYDIGWVGAMQSRRRYDDEEWHVAVLRGVDEGAQLFVDGELVAEREDFTAENDNEFVFKVGAANEDFGGTQYGEIENVAYWAHGLSEEEARAQSELEDWRAGEFRPDFHWDPDPEAVAPPQAGDVLRAPIRLQADSSEVRFANIWVAPLGEVAHASIIEGWNEDTLARGAEVYAGTCLACHGPDGERTLNPQARPFATAPLQNGSDPRSLYETIRGGFREMPSNEWLEPEDTYAVVQYIRETFLRERNAEQYFAVDGAYLAGLPKGRRHGLAAGEADELPPRDYGPALGAQLGRAIGSGLAIPLGRGVTLGYDLQTMSSPGAWDGFLQLANTQHYQQRGEAIAQPAEETQPGLDGYGWGFEGTLDWDRARRPARGPLPADWLDYRGYHDGEHGLVLESYVEGRHVYERPGLDRAAGIDVISHRYSVGGGERELVLQLARAPEGWDGALAQFSLAAEDGRLGAEVLLLGKSTGDLLEPFTALALIGVESGLELDEEGRVALRIAPALERQEFYVLRYGSPWGDEADAFVNLVDNRREGALPPSADQDLARAEQRWPEVFETRGELGEGDGAYVVDTLPLPPENPWNAWFRTSALAFFNDGRAAVTTYGGDVWIVDGIDADLDVLRWKRFAAGLFEPMGALVVDGKVLVTCRDRIVRLHDTDGNGEADRYESFFPDPDTTASFHSFSFDLQRDAQGFLYYAKSGQYTDYALPGSILKVAPDGRSHEVYSTGLRTPNGMGMSPDGRPLVSDNQGNWIPASKVSLSFPGAFHGVFRSINTGGAGEQTRDTFDRPVIWMPQRLDSSSGGQLWVDDERFGPLSGRYLHTSFGKGWMYPLVIDVVDGVEQAAVWRLPFQFDAGLQRLRKNPIDGQVYAVGLSGWQGPGGGQDGCLQRVRWTGRDVPLLVGARSTSVGIELEFSGPLDAQALDLERFRAKRWNYEWARRYGSAHWSVAQPGREGEDEVDVLALSLSADGRRLDLQLADMVECDQLVLDFRATALGGEEIAEEVFLTVNRVPGP